MKEIRNCVKLKIKEENVADLQNSRKKLSKEIRNEKTQTYQERSSSFLLLNHLLQ